MGDDLEDFIRLQKQKINKERQLIQDDDVTNDVSDFLVIFQEQFST